MKPTISKPFKSNDRTFDKVYNAFDKRDYFNSQGLAKTQIGNFERALQKNDKGAQQVLDLFKGDEKKAKDYITQVISDRNKERAFNNYKALKDAVDSIQKGKPNVGAVDYVKRIIHNSSQKYSIALYSTLRNKKFTKWKDVHNDIDDLIGEGFSSDAQRKAAFANGYEEKDKKNEGKKRFKRQDGIGKAKYTISYHDGKKKHKDGSDFFDIKIFKNKKDLSDFVGTLAKQGYKLTRESVNEASKLAMGIAGFTGTRGVAVDDFINTHNIDAKKLFNFVKKGNLKDRMAFVSAIAGRPNNKMFKMITKQFGESVNESKSEVEQIAKKTKSETAFYDVLSKIEKKYGKRNYRLWLEKSLKDLGVNPKHYDYRTNASAEEKLYQLTK